VRFSLIVAAVLVAVAWPIWGVGIAVLVAIGSMLGLLIGAFRRALGARRQVAELGQFGIVARGGATTLRWASPWDVSRA
jgi:hypothetical protein